MLPVALAALGGLTLLAACGDDDGGGTTKGTEVKVTLSEFKIEMPTDMPGAAPGSDPFATPPQPDASGAAGANDPLAPAPLTSSEDEDKKMQDLFGSGKK